MVRLAAPRDPLVINAGELRHPIEIEKPSYAPDAIGGMSVIPTSWVNVRSTWAAIYTAGGRETSMASQVVSQVSHTVKVRWTATVLKANYRVVFQGRIFIVAYVENVGERNRVQLLYCNEIDGGGV